MSDEAGGKSGWFEDDAGGRIKRSKEKLMQCLQNLFQKEALDAYGLLAFVIIPFLALRMSAAASQWPLPSWIIEQMTEALSGLSQEQIDRLLCDLAQESVGKIRAEVEQQYHCADLGLGMPVY